MVKGPLISIAAGIFLGAAIVLLRFVGEVSIKDEKNNMVIECMKIVPKYQLSVCQGLAK